MPIRRIIGSAGCWSRACPTDRRTRSRGAAWGAPAGHNHPIIGQGLSMALRDVRLLSEIILDGRRDQGTFRPYVAERAERLRRLRITARLRAKLYAEFGEEARQRRQRAERRMRVDKAPSPFGAIVHGPDKLPATTFEPSTIDAL